MTHNEWMSSLAFPFSSQLAQVVALRHESPDAGLALVHLLEEEGLPVFPVRPPLPWDSVAPLRHLCSYWQKEWPSWSERELELSAFWLGRRVFLSRLFLRVAESLRGCQAVVWIDLEDLHAPIWGDFLQLARQNQLHIPVTFAFHATPEERIPLGVRSLKVDLSEAELKKRKRLAQKHFGRPLPTRTAQYLGQILVLGDTYQAQSIRKISRARHGKQVAKLQDAKVLSEDFQIVLDSLRFAKAQYPRCSKSWRKRVLHQSVPEHVKLWLEWGHPPVMISKNPLQSFRKETLLMAHDEALCALVSGGDDGLLEEVHYISGLLCSSVERKEKTGLQQSHPQGDLTPLMRVRVALGLPTDPIKVLQSNYQDLLASGATWSAALLACELVRWHLAFGRIHQAFPLLKRFQGVEDWAVQWLIHVSFARAFARIHRGDLARSHLEKAIAATPKPMSPVLLGEVRLCSAILSESSGNTEAAELQRNEARVTFRAAGDGMRLGMYLLALGEHHWRKKELEDARNSFGRALDIFRRYGDGMGVIEARLKLGLVIKEAPITTLYPPPENR